MLFDKNGNGLAEIQKYATWTSDHNFQHIAKALELAQKKVLTIIDKATYKIAEDHYWSDNYEESYPSAENLILDELVHKFQVILVNFAYSKNLWKDTVIWDNSGIKVQWDNDYRPAQQPTLDNLVDSFTHDGYEFLDLLIDFLNENKETFPDFQTSVEGRNIKSLFINSANEFSYYFNINNSVSYFFEILDVLRRVQRGEIMRTLGIVNYNMCVVYQMNRLEIEASERWVNTVAELDLLVPTTNEVVLVTDENRYYQYSGAVWVAFADNMSEMIDLVKPVIVDYTMYMKFYSDINNINPKSKQLEIVRANAQLLKESGENGLKRLGDYVMNLTATEDLETPQTAVPDSLITKNSFMI